MKHVIISWPRYNNWTDWWCFALLCWPWTSIEIGPPSWTGLPLGVTLSTRTTEVNLLVCAIETIKTVKRTFARLVCTAWIFCACGCALRFSSPLDVNEVFSKIQHPLIQSVQRPCFLLLDCRYMPAHAPYTPSNNPRTDVKYYRPLH